MKKLTEDQEKEFQRIMQGYDGTEINKKLEVSRWGWLIGTLIPIAFAVLIFVSLMDPLIPYIPGGWKAFFGPIDYFNSSSLDPAKTPSSCKSAQSVLRFRLIKYRQEHGLYPKEENWGDFLDNPEFWPDYPAPKYCPEGSDPPHDYPYEYKSDSVRGSKLIANEHGTGYSKYEVRCTNPECSRQIDDGKAN